MTKVSFLIGSGFSVPASYPTTTKLNQRLQKIDASEICVDSSRTARFLNSQPDPNASWMGVKERQFVQEFLEFYNTRVLQSSESFHYETFFDYYISAYLTQSYSNDLLKFLTNFQNQHKTISDFHHLLMEFNDTFSQLLAQLLTKQLKCVHYCKPYDPTYNNFLLLLEELAKAHTVHIHTLNHDLYLEHLSLSDSIQGRLDDGFDDLGSEIFAKKYDKYATYMVRLRRFTNKYEEPFCLYKLHGSIDTYWVSFGEESGLVKIPWGVSTHEIHKEVLRNGRPEYVYRPTDVLPDFLSGTTHKVSRYQSGSYYPIVLEHFYTNLKQSKTLIVIGYGFGDSRINSYLEENFLNDPAKAMFVVDIVHPSTCYLDRPSVHFIGGGVSEMTIDLICKNIDA